MEELIKIGIGIRKLRKENTNLGYIEFSMKVGMDKKTYYNIERGEKDFNFSNLMKVLAFHQIKLSDFFQRAGL